jgi:hypothetical protein
VTFFCSFLSFKYFVFCYLLILLTVSLSSFLSLLLLFHLRFLSIRSFYFIDYEDDFGYTPLHAAVMSCNPFLVEVLLVWTASACFFLFFFCLTLFFNFFLSSITFFSRTVFLFVCFFFFLFVYLCMLLSLSDAVEQQSGP